MDLEKASICVRIRNVDFKTNTDGGFLCFYREDKR